MYGILASAGCSHGVPSIPNGVFRVKKDHTWTMIANLQRVLTGASDRQSPPIT